jgi:hypothetical protein
MGTNDAEVGTVCRVGDEEYIKVYNTGADRQISKGLGATCSLVTGYSVTVSSVSNDVFVGVVKHSTLTTGTYGWLVRKGFVSVNLGADGSCAAGAPLMAGVDGVFQGSVSTTFTSAHLFTGNTYAKAMEAIASGASGSAYISIY